MASTENTTVGIKAIKVSKLDADGINQNSQLQEGDLISLSFQDLGIQRFTIQSISEFSNYYLYYVNPVSLGTNNSDFDEPQNVSGTGTGVINAGNYELQGTGGGLINGKRFADFNLVNNNTKWTFTDSTGVFSETIGLGGNRFGITVNYEVNVYTDSSTPGISFGIFPSGSGFLVTYNNDVTSTRSEDTINGNVVSLKGSVYGPGQTRTIRGSFNIVASNTTTNFGIIPVSNYSGAKFFFPTSSISFNITSLTTSSTDVDGLNTVIEPYTSNNIRVSDYNATINNATGSRINEFYMDVDYSSDAIVAVNSDTILNGSATRATVQYSNYTSERVTRPRYDGSKTTNLYLNKWTKSGSLYTNGDNINLVWEGDKSFGKTANVNQFGDFALIYDGQSPVDKINGPSTLSTAINIIGAFDASGNIDQPNQSTPYFYNGKSAFGGGNIAQFTVYSSESVSTSTLSRLQAPQTSSGVFTYINSLFTTASGSVLSNNAFDLSGSNTYMVNNVEFPVASAAYPPYFTTGSSSKSVLTASSLFSSYFRENEESGSRWTQAFNGAVSNIREGYDEALNIINPTPDYTQVAISDFYNRFTVTTVSNSGSGAAYRYFIHLDRDLSPTDNPDAFMFLNISNDTSKFYIENNFSGSVIGKGFIFNEYISPDFESSLDSTIIEIEDKGLI